jgi:hypothetical protein
MNWLKSLFGGSSPEKKAAPIIEDYHERGIGKEYRRPDDPAHVIRINQNQPKGSPRKLENYVEVTGVSQPEHRTSLESLIAGKERQITLERDPDNPHDPNAIKVIGHWMSKDSTGHTSQIGWVPKALASAVIKEVPDGPLGANIEAMFRPVSNKSAGIRISIWGPRNQRTHVEPNEDNEQHFLTMIAETEINNKKTGQGVIPSCYEDLAKLYRRQKEYDKEVALLERFAKQKHSPGVMPAKLLERLEKARHLSEKK